MNIDQKQNQYIKTLQELTDPGAQWDFLFMLGASKDAVSSIRNPGCLIPECQTQIWLKIFRRYPTVNFSCDSDSILVRGVLKIFEDLYLNRSAEEIAACPPRFPDSIFEDVIYPQIKKNGLKTFYEALKK